MAVGGYGKWSGRFGGCSWMVGGFQQWSSLDRREAAVEHGWRRGSRELRQSCRLVELWQSFGGEELERGGCW